MRILENSILQDHCDVIVVEAGLGGMYVAAGYHRAIREARCVTTT